MAARYFRAVSARSEEGTTIRGKDFIIPPGAVPRQPDHTSFVQRVVRCGLVDMCKRKMCRSNKQDPYWTAQDRFLTVIGGASFVGTVFKQLTDTDRRKELRQQIACLEKSLAEKEEELKTNLLLLKEKRSEHLKILEEKENRESWFSRSWFSRLI